MSQQLENFFDIIVLQFVGCLLGGSMVGLTHSVFQICCSQWPCLSGRPLFNHPSTGDPQTLTGRSGSVSGDHFLYHRQIESFPNVNVDNFIIATQNFWFTSRNKGSEKLDPLSFSSNKQKLVQRYLQERAYVFLLASCFVTYLNSTTVSFATFVYALDLDVACCII